MNCQFDVARVRKRVTCDLQHLEDRPPQTMDLRVSSCSDPVRIEGPQTLSRSIAQFEFSEVATILQPTGECARESRLTSSGWTEQLDNHAPGPKPRYRRRQISRLTAQITSASGRSASTHTTRAPENSSRCKAAIRFGMIAGSISGSRLAAVSGVTTSLMTRSGGRRRARAYAAPSNRRSQCGAAAKRVSKGPSLKPRISFCGYRSARTIRPRLAARLAATSFLRLSAATATDQTMRSRLYNGWSAGPAILS